MSILLIGNALLHEKTTTEWNKKKKKEKSASTLHLVIHVQTHMAELNDKIVKHCIHNFMY